MHEAAVTVDLRAVYSQKIHAFLFKLFAR